MSMKKEIVYTDEYALILSDEQIKDARSHWRKWHLEDNSIINQFPTYLTDLTQCKLIIAHLPLSDAPMLEGVPLLPPLPQGDNVEELAKHHFRKSEYEIQLREEAYIAGYNKAKEKYKYTEADLEIAMNWLFETKGRKGLEDLIERLNQPSRPTHFECGMLCGRCSAFDDECWSAKECTRGYDYPDIMRTTTNSQGQIELVGKYI